ncbi:MAG: serine hydrolase [Candidatus Parcubacteria bacterium]|nr:serine hydrolase [Candidatus Parcubacteria bacterium]
MLLFFLTSLFALNSVVHLPIAQSAVINEAINLEQVQQFPKSLGIALTAKSALVMNADSGKIVFQKNIDQPLPIASLTKLMSALVFINTNSDWQKTVIYSVQDNIPPKERQQDLEPSQIVFHDGEQIKISDLFTAALVKSANNAINALARQTSFCCGNSFVGQMSKTAQTLNMKQTSFVEPTGLSLQDVSSARDLSQLILAVKDKKEISDALSRRTYTFYTIFNKQSIFHRVNTTNQLLDSFLQTKLAKTGYLDEAGYCFAGLVSYQKNNFVVIVLGAHSEHDRQQEVKGLTVWAAENH